eukprot:scaffold84108_cov27-Tisochrysis_lutea.AAC.4
MAVGFAGNFLQWLVLAKCTSATALAERSVHDHEFFSQQATRRRRREERGRAREDQGRLGEGVVEGARAESEAAEWVAGAPAGARYRDGE